MMIMRYTFAQTSDGYLVQTTAWNDPYTIFMELLTDTRSSELLDDVLTAYTQEIDWSSTTDLLTVALNDQYLILSYPVWCCLDEDQTTCCLPAESSLVLWDAWMRIATQGYRTIVLEWDGGAAFHFEVFDELYL